MLRKLKVLTALTLAFTIVPVLGTNVYAEEAVEEAAVVSTYEELKDAVTAQKPKIELGDNITTEEKINITYPVEIDGKGYTLSGTHTAGWTSYYVLQVYRTSAVIKDIKLTSGDAGLVVNGSDVTLLGTVDVSGNEFGGIEVSQGVGVTEVPVLKVNGTLLNTTETKTEPTIWKDGTVGSVEGMEFDTDDTVKPGQTHYYLKEDVVVEEDITTAEQFVAAVAAGQTEIKLGADIELTEKVNVLYDVTIDGQGHTISNANPQEGWHGEYALQFYNTNATLGNVTFEGFDAAVLVNGSTLTVNGDLTFVNMEFGGIELTQGTGVTNVPEVIFEDVALLNEHEDYGQPTVWIDGEEGIVNTESLNNHFLFERTDVKEGQTQYYLDFVTEKEFRAFTKSYTYFTELSTKEVEVKIVQETGNIQITKLGSKLTADDIINTFVSLIADNDAVKAYEINGVLHTEVSDKEVLTEQLTAAYAAMSSTTRATATDINVSELLKAPFAFRLYIDVDGTVVPANEVLVQLSENVKAPVVDTDKPEDKKEETTTTPPTGIENNFVMYSSILVLGAIILVNLRSKKIFSK